MANICRIQSTSRYARAGAMDIITTDHTQKYSQLNITKFKDNQPVETG